MNGVKLLAKTSVITAIVQYATPGFAASAGTYALQLSSDCAKQCALTGYDSSAWSTFTGSDYFTRCAWVPALFTVDGSVAIQNSSIVVQACMAEDFVDPSPSEDLDTPDTNLTRRHALDAACRAIPAQFDTETSRRPAEDPSKVIPGQVLGAAGVIKDYLLRQSLNNNVSDGFVARAHYGNAVVGIYFGSEFDKSDFANGVLQDFIHGVEKGGMGQTLQTQLCDDNGTASSVFGIIADTSSGVDALSTVQSAIKAWSRGSCAGGLEVTTPKANNVTSINRVLSDSSSSPGNWTGWGQDKMNQTGSVESSDLLQVNRLAMNTEAGCRTVEVAKDDICDTLAKKCKITTQDFQNFNKPRRGDWNSYCNGLQLGQEVCCSAGGLPDIRPKRQPNGQCAVYNVFPGEWCASIATKHGLYLDELQGFNKNTWGFDCDRLYPNTKMCVSDGDPPFPAANPTAVCGPTKPGTRPPSGGKSSEWAKLNPCPLNACCNVWGNCGVDKDFCVDQSTGSPGTSKGQNGCIANCGMVITNNKSPPKEFRTVGYFESWNQNRKCLFMDVDDIPQLSTKYTHIHFAFADITTDYQVSVSKVQDQFDKFRRAKGYKRILAFGGWAFSTEPKTHAIFRDGVRPGNRERLATNLANFIVQNDLDGIDFDWEYPSVPDMDWLPKSSPEEAPNYLAFLKLMRSKLPQKSISIAAPASFWYLRAFPIGEMAKVVDYIVYMTYDLHGQWDYGNKWSMEGCENGDCLRSHVAFMETYNTLAMITKAGVPSDKITVGIASYGRQFKMIDPNCFGKDCKFVGPKSAATPGRCTDTPEYISLAEIKEILQKNPRAKVYEEGNGGASKYMTYDGNWVSYMDDKDKSTRTNLYKSMNFGGVVEWAISLNSFQFDDSSRPKNPSNVIKGNDGLRGGVGGQPGGFADSCSTENDAWRKVQCTTKGIADPDLPPVEAWADVKADTAWCAAVKNWLAGGHGTKSFPEVVSDFLKGPPGFHCEKAVGGNGCSIPPSCLASEKATGAAMQPLLRALSNINTQFVNMHQGLTDAAANSKSDLDLFKATFIPKPDKSLEIILNILTMAVGFGSASFFNGWLKSSVWGAANKPIDKVLADNLKDYTRDAISAGWQIGKDFNKNFAAKKLTKVPEKIDYIFSHTVTDWQESMRDINEVIFKGDENSFTILKNLLSDGKSLDHIPTNAADITKSTKKFLYSTIIPEAWRMQGFYPVLLYTAFPCDTPGIGVRQWTNKNKLDEQIICKDGLQYQLWAVEGKFGCKESNNPCRPPTDCHTLLSDLPGLKDIRKKVREWGELDVFSMADSAFNGYNNVWHGNHKYNQNDVENDDLVNVVANSLPKDSIDLSALPGVVNIPICTWAEIKANWAKGPGKADPDTYPCNHSAQDDFGFVGSKIG